ncbi:MAG: PilZ domain-containing protein [Alphaproteobacteria bacterium]|nr:PilZ domain-containing protein [Alphaproteobacteria bacterium]
MKSDIIDQTNPHTSAERRQFPRRKVRIEAKLIAGRKVQPTVIEDLSAGGAGLRNAIGVFANDPVEIELNGGRRLKGVVAWWLTGYCGVQFDQTLAADDPLLLLGHAM